MERFRRRARWNRISINDRLPDLIPGAEERADAGYADAEY